MPGRSQGLNKGWTVACLILSNSIIPPDFNYSRSQERNSNYTLPSSHLKINRVNKTKQNKTTALLVMTYQVLGVKSGEKQILKIKLE